MVESRTYPYFLLAANLPALNQLKGQTLAEYFIQVVSDYEANTGDEARNDAGSRPVSFMPVRYKIARLRAQSFRGLAPAGEEWEYDFGGNTHVLHGPNGCGKSSLLGAIAWCLTGRLFRDDCEPSPPQQVDVYTCNGERTRKLERPDGLTLLDADGLSSSPRSPYWVALELLGEDQQPVWLRRHSDDGLQYGTDCQTWHSIASIEDAGISELDAELHVLMPARISYLRFGKNPDLIDLFSRIVGLDDLESIAETAAGICTSLRSSATRITNKDISPSQSEIEAIVNEMDKTACAEVSDWSEFKNAMLQSRTLAQIVSLGELLKRSCDEARGLLAADLGLNLPDEGSEERAKIQDSLRSLPGQVNSVVEVLSRAMERILPQTFGLAIPTEEDLDRLKADLSTFEDTVAKETGERLEWASKELSDAKAMLMLEASRHFNPERNTCPVCEQRLEPVPAVSEELMVLKDHLALPHLRKEIQDHELSLRNRLDQLIPHDKRQAGMDNLSIRILADWEQFRLDRMNGLLASIADSFDERVKGLAETCVLAEPCEPFVIPGIVSDTDEATYPRLMKEVNEARNYVRLLSALRSHLTELCELQRILTDLSRPDSLANVLNRGKEANEIVISYQTTYASTRQLYKKQETLEQLKGTTERYRSLADATERTKQLASLVRQEIISTVDTIRPRMQALYTSLYDNEFLPFNILTAGHPANPEVKDQINAYLQSGLELVPVGPFSNAGRLRALALCFVFALLERTHKTLAFIVLDDPALSMDDHHKARFIAYLLVPVQADLQILLGTHYETFFSDAKTKLPEAVVRCLTPRRSNADALAFEPDDRLKRLKAVLERPTTEWRSAAIECRKWLEEALQTLSSYSPVPFVIRTDLPGSVSRYRAITDPRVATENRTAILGILTPEFIREIHEKTAHVGAVVVESDVRDILKKLEDCEKGYKKELSAFREYSQRDLQARAFRPRPAILPLEISAKTTGKKLPVVGMAAASDRGVGIEWQEYSAVEIEDSEIAIVKFDSLAPVALPGQIVLLDSEEISPESGDLIVAKSQDGRSFLRRFWKMPDSTIIFEAVNPNCPYEPVGLLEGNYRVRRMVGVLFDTFRHSSGSLGDEWMDPGQGFSTNLAGLQCIRVHGKSMEPVAREGQLVLISKSPSSDNVADGDMVCVDLESLGTVVKRFYSSNGRVFLNSINSTGAHPPIDVAQEKIKAIHLIRGVLFERYGELERERD